MVGTGAGRRRWGRRCWFLIVVVVVIIIVSVLMPLTIWWLCSGLGWVASDSGNWFVGSHLPLGRWGGGRAMREKSLDS